MPAFSTRLLAWGDHHGRKDLPWQHPRTPYRVWVAEIMLQQTQVKTVIPYFNQFVKQFPDIPSLAAASLDAVLALWSGLGYYARARNLHKAARLCEQQHGAALPTTAQALLALPGIGASTANAIFSQAYDQPAVVLDGNVKRVLARHRSIPGWPGRASVHQQLWAAAEQLLPETRGTDYTQAIMDLGATLCTRTKPDCGQCPIKTDCEACKTGTVAQFPAPRPKLKIRKHSFHMLILTDHAGRVLLERRPPAGIWGGLWSLPAHDESQSLSERLDISCKDLRRLPSISHQLTHIKMTIHPLIGHAKTSARRVECNLDQRWCGQAEWPALGLPKPVRQLLEKHLAYDTRRVAQND